MKNKDARLIRNIAWWIGGEGCEDDVSDNEYAIRIIKMVRDHDKRLTQRAADGDNAALREAAKQSMEPILKKCPSCGADEDDCFVWCPRGN